MASLLLFPDLTDDSLLLLTERLLCLGARFEQLSAQSLDELEGVIEHISPVVERQRYNSAASENKIVFVFTCSCFKCSRNSFLVIAKPKQFLAIQCPSMLQQEQDLTLSLLDLA